MRRSRATSTTRALAPWLAIMALLVAGGVYYKRTYPALPDDAARAVARTEDPVASDPVARFNETRVGHLLFMQPDGRVCRRVLFDNVSGGFRNAGHIECLPKEQGQPATVDSSRFDAIRNSFKR